jgi:hypothetical protein
MFNRLFVCPKFGVIKKYKGAVHGVCERVFLLLFLESMKMYKWGREKKKEGMKNTLSM